VTLAPMPARILLGPGPCLIAPSVMRAMATPVLSHLDPDLLSLLDWLREGLARVFRAPDGAAALAVSGTGTSAMETAIATLVDQGTRVTVVTTGYFGDRLVEMCARYGAAVSKVAVEWGRACDPDALERALDRDGADLVAFVHGETSTGVLNPARELAAIARAHGARTLVDAVTTLGGHELDMAAWQADAVYSCAQKCIGAPSGLSPLAVAPGARRKTGRCRSFYLDLDLIEDYWVRRRYHHTLSSTLAYALAEAVKTVEEEGLEARWRRHERHHRALAAGLAAMNLSLLPPEGERLWTLNAVRVPERVDEAAIRVRLREQFNIEIGAGLGPLAGKVWRIGLMGASSAPDLVLLLLEALEAVLTAEGHAVPRGAGAGAAAAFLATART
jgi:alanine-glyoxylate transaminase/serine-glyoxylate transaminase/serine-pyruvate transaminase